MQNVYCTNHRLLSVCLSVCLSCLSVYSHGARSQTEVSKKILMLMMIIIKVVIIGVKYKQRSLNY